MKTKFSSAEKVSDNFLAERKRKFDSQCETLQHYVYDSNLKRSGEKMFDFLEPFVKRSDEILSSSDDNYQKLRQFIHLEKEFKDYIESKKCVLDIIDEFIKYVLMPYSFPIFVKTARVFLGKFQQVRSKMAKSEYPWDFSDLDPFQRHTYICPQADWDYTRLDLLELEDVEQIIQKLVSLCIELFCKWAKEVQESSEKVVDFSIIIDDFMYYESSFQSTRMGYEYIVRICIDYVLTHMMPEKPNVVSEWFVAWLSALKCDVPRFRVVCYDCKKDFWNALALFGCYTEEFEQNKGEHHYNPHVYTLVTESMLQGLIVSRLFYRLDFKGLDLSKESLEQVTIIDCNLKGTGASINMSTLNKGLEIHYIEGEKVNRFDLTKSCFQGCNVHVDDDDDSVFSNFSFTDKTFDENVLRRIEAYDRRITKGMEKYHFPVLCGKQVFTRFEKCVMQLPLGGGV